MTLSPVLAPTSKRPLSEILQPPASQVYNNLVRRNFNTSTILLAGALVQGLIVLIVPRVWALIPVVLVLVARFADAIAVTLHFKANPYLEGVIHQKWTTVIPDTDGNQSGEGADEKVAVLHLCLKMNHPLGYYAPNVQKTRTWAARMAVQLDQQSKTNGFLGQSEFVATDNKGAAQTMLLSYWRSIDDIHTYSQGPLHREAWTWWDKQVQMDPENMKHVGISHEIFEAPKGRWEDVSINFQPTRLGATSYFRKGDKLIGGTVEDQWISPIVEARGRFRTSVGRLNWVSNANSRTAAAIKKEEC